MTPFSIRKTIIIGYIIAIAIISFFAIYTYLNMRKAMHENRGVEETLQALRTIETLFDDLQDIETGQRGYIISGNESFLQPYYDGLQRIKEDSTALRHLQTNDTKRKQDIAHLLALVKQKLDFAANTVSLRQDSGYLASEKKIETEQGKELMDTIRILSGKMEAADRAILNAYTLERQMVAQNTTRLFFILAALFFIFLITFFFLVRRDIRGRMHAELTSQVNEKTDAFKNILYRISDGFIALDKDWRYTFANAKACEILGKSESALIGKQIWEESPHAVGNAFYNAYHLAMKTQEYVFIESFHDRMDRWFECDVYPSPNGLSIHFRDITEKKKTASELENVRERFKVVAKATNDVLWEADLVKKTLWWNDNFYEKFGYSREVIGDSDKTWENYLHPEDKERVMQHVASVVNDPEQNTWNDEYRFARIDGTYVEIYDRSYILRTPAGKAYKMIGSMADVTSLFDAKKEVQRKEEQYRTLVEQATDGIFIADTSGKFVVVNSAGCRLAQYTLEEMMDRTIYDLVDAEDLKKNPFHFGEMIEKGGARVERLMKRKDGTVIDIEVNAKFLSDGRFLCFIRDITERKKAQEAIIKEKALADKLIDSLPGVFYFYDANGKFIRWNKQLETVTGYSPEEIANMHPVQLFAEQDKAYITDRIMGVFEMGMNDAEASFATKTGETIPYYFKAALIQYEGQPCLLGSGIDISDRKKAEDEIRQSEQKYRLLFHNNPMPMLMIAIPELDIIDVNESAIMHYGYSREEFLQMNSIDLRPPEDVARYLESSRKINPGVRHSGVWSHRKKDGTIIKVDVIAHDLYDNGKPIRLVLANDVTEKLKAEQAVKDSLENIRQLTDHVQNIREEERAHIAREIHDELGQQLTVLKMDVSWLNKKIGQEEGPISDKLKSLTSMLDGTVRTVRRISSELRPSLLDDLGLVATLDWHLKEFETRFGIKTSFKEPDTHMEIPDAFKTGLFRIFQESLTNVARHANATEVRASFNQVDDRFVMSIEDDGVGFNPEKRAGSRTLGILGMKERTAMMGGSYNISSLPGKGTVVVVSVPLVTASSNRN